MSAEGSCQYDVSPDGALSAIRTHAGPLLVDFDETLYLRNSTEDFIDCARPGLLALLLLRILDILKPWHLTGGISTRDTWRICTISILLPWTHWRWCAKVRMLAERYVNQELKVELKALPRSPIILTNGFKTVVMPLLAAMGFRDVPLIAARKYSFTDPRDGKLRMAINELGAEAVGESLMVTDSLNDLDILQHCRRPLRTVWPGAAYRRALGRIYLPGEYISRIKRPGTGYIFRSILMGDFALWLLSSIGLAERPIVHFAALLLLLVSFWAIYERGYVDNDLIASRYETDPTLTAAYYSISIATPIVQPWIWAILAGAAGVWMLHPEAMSFIVHSACWMTVLIVTHACFLIYNRLDKTTRVWLYPVLQAARSAALTVIVPIVPAATAALGAQVLSQWIPYLVYRHTAGHWPDTRLELTRLVAYALLLLISSCAFGTSVWFTWSALALLLWNVYRARRDIYAVFSSARRLDRHPRMTMPGAECGPHGQARNAG